MLGIPLESAVKITVTGDGKTLRVEPFTEEQLAEEGKLRFDAAREADLQINDEVYRKLADR